MSRHQFYVATSFLPIVEFPGRDTKNPGRDLPHCHPCHDLKNDAATSNPTKPGRDLKIRSRPASVPLTERPCRHLKTLVATPNLLSPIQPGRDVHFWSRPQADQTRSRPQSHVATSISFSPSHNMNFHVTTQNP